jgi:hypothetical protein
MSPFTNLLQFITHPAAPRFLREKRAFQLELIYKIARGRSKTRTRAVSVVSDCESLNFLRVGSEQNSLRLALDAECLYFLLKVIALALFYGTNG